MAKNKEIEIQVQIQRSNKLISFLEKNGKFVGQQHQVDTYFTPAYRDFTGVRPILEWLRLRKSGKKYSINYKNWHLEKDGRSHFCDEYESEISDLKQLKNIFRALNMKKLVTVEKTRKIWVYEDYEIAVDSIDGLGDFVEIEYKGKPTKVKPKVIVGEMVNFLKKFNPGKISRNYQGYAFMLLFPKEIETEIV